MPKFSLNHKIITHAAMAFLCAVALMLPIAATATTPAPQHLNHVSCALTDECTPWQLPRRYFSDRGKKLLIVATRPSLQPPAPQIEAVEGLRFLFKPTQEFAEASAWPLTNNPAPNSPLDTQILSRQILAALTQGERVFVICDERHFEALAQAIEHGLLCIG